MNPQFIRDAQGQLLKIFLDENGTWRQIIMPTLPHAQLPSSVLGDSKDGFLQLVVNQKGRLGHWYSEHGIQWTRSDYFAEKCNEAPSLIEASDGFLQIVVNVNGKLQHWWRNRRNILGQDHQTWSPTSTFGNQCTNSPCLIEAADGHLQVVTRVGNVLEHWYRTREPRWEWVRTAIFADNEACSAPCLIEQDGLHVVVRTLRGTLAHWCRRSNNEPWEKIADIPSVPDGVRFNLFFDGEVGICVIAVEDATLQGWRCLDGNQWVSIRMSPLSTVELVDEDSPVIKKFVNSFQGFKEKSFIPLEHVLTAPGALNPSNDSPVVNIYLEQEKQSILGFGASMTQSSAINIMNCQEPLRKEIFEQLFDKKKGNGISLVRVPIGASDFSIKEYTYQDNENEPFSIEPDRIIIDALKEAKRYNPDFSIIAAPWSAPAWMKTNNRLHGGSLREDCYQAYADYLVKFIRAYEAEGLSIYAITPQNEPLHDTARYPCMKMTSTECIAFVKVLGDTFREEKIETKIIIYDHNFNQKNGGIEYVKTVFDADVFDYVDGSAWHHYTDASPLEVLNELNKLGYSNKSIYFTERTTQVIRPNDLDAVRQSYGSFEYLLNIFMDVVEGGSVCCLAWNLALNKKCGPVIGRFKDGAGVVQIDHDRNEYVKNGSYDAIGFFSRFVMPSALCLKTEKTGVLNAIKVLAFRLPNHELVILCVNNHEHNQELILQFQVSEDHPGSQIFLNIDAKSATAFQFNSASLVIRNVPLLEQGQGDFMNVIPQLLFAPPHCHNHQGNNHLYVNDALNPPWNNNNNQPDNEFLVDDNIVEKESLEELPLDEQATRIVHEDINSNLLQQGIEASLNSGPVGGYGQLGNPTLFTEQRAIHDQNPPWNNNNNQQKKFG